MMRDVAFTLLCLAALAGLLELGWIGPAAVRSADTQECRLAAEAMDPCE